MRGTREALLMAVCGIVLAMPSLAARPASAPVPIVEGKEVFDHWCSACHADNYRAGGTAALAFKYGKALPAALEQRKDLTPDVIAYFVRHGVSVMPTFRKTEITEAELAALSAYLTRNNATIKKR